FCPFLRDMHLPCFLAGIGGGPIVSLQPRSRGARGWIRASSRQSALDLQTIVTPMHLGPDCMPPSSRCNTFKLFRRCTGRIWDVSHLCGPSAIHSVLAQAEFWACRRHAFSAISKREPPSF